MLITVELRLKKVGIEVTEWNDFDVFSVSVEMKQQKLVGKGQSGISYDRWESRDIT